jgi:CRISPR-associated endonuclease/helicase Cas3
MHRPGCRSAGLYHVHGSIGGDARDGFGLLRCAADFWDAPVVVTIAAQLSGRRIANRTARCRMLHNRADSVIALDEAQTLAMRLLCLCVMTPDEPTNRAAIATT